MRTSFCIHETPRGHIFELSNRILHYRTLMDLIQHLDNVHNCLRENDLTIPMYIRGVLTVPTSDITFRENLLFNAEGICSDLSRHSTSGSVFLWAFEIVKTKLCQEVVSLTHQKMGLHFNASKTTSEYLEGSFIQTAAQKIKETALYLWTLGRYRGGY